MKLQGRVLNKFNKQGLIIFDCDGVLVDSEQLAAQVFSNQLLLQGISLSAQECFDSFKGHTLAACLDKLNQMDGVCLTEQFLEQLRQSTQKTFTEHLRPVEGVCEVLQFAKSQGIAFCVASNGGLKKVAHSLSVTGLAKFFDGAIFSAEQVAQGKPAPDLFLYAAKTMGVPPKDCCVIEDSMSGVEAALNANMQVALFQGSGAVLFHCEGESEVERFQSMDQLLIGLESSLSV